MSALTRFFFTLALAASAPAAAVLSAAQAADGIRYVSTTGKNSNTCTLAAPCRALQRAINLAPAGGEVRILDSGFYGNNATIRKSLTITGNGFNVILAAPIVVNAAGAVVTLRGLMLDGQGAVTTGIRVDAAAAVHVERCVVRGFSGVGIAATAQGVGLFVVDTISRDNGGSGVSTNAVRLTVDNSRFENNAQSGLTVLSSEATIRRSIASGNGTSGIIALLSSAEIASTSAVQNGSAGFSAQSSTITIDSSAASGNDAGLRLDSAATARISNSTFTRNATGISNSGGGLVETRANNTVRGNTTDVTGTLTPTGALYRTRKEPSAMHRQLASSPIIKLQQDFAAEGAFGAIMRYVREGKVNNTVAEGWAAFVFKDLGDRVSEAKQEIRRIEQVLERLSQVCALGAKMPVFEELALKALGLSRELNTLDGWLISLYETELTMLLFVNPPRAKAIPLQMARSMQALMQKRIAEGNFLLKAPELFKPG